MNYSLPQELFMTKQQQIDILNVDHPSVKAKIALQGAQLLSWQPTNLEQDVLWLSEVEPFKLGNAIRGGVPICYPWFGSVKQPAHGTARIRPWTLQKYAILPDSVLLEFALEQEATVTMELGESCWLMFTHLGQTPAQVALHSYFRIGDIRQVELHHLPKQAFDSISQTEQAVSSPRKFANLVDEIYAFDGKPTVIVDPVYDRQIIVEHNNASDVVVWNPWHKPMSGMSETGYQTMVCVETARLYQQLEQGESISVKLRVESR